MVLEVQPGLGCLKSWVDMTGGGLPSKDSKHKTEINVTVGQEGSTNANNYKPSRLLKGRYRYAHKCAYHVKYSNLPQYQQTSTHPVI